MVALVSKSPKFCLVWVGIGYHDVLTTTEAEWLASQGFKCTKKFCFSDLSRNNVSLFLERLTVLYIAAVLFIAMSL